MRIKHTKMKLNNDESESKKKKITSLILKQYGDKEEEGNIPEINESVEDIMNNSEEIDDQMSNIIDDVNYSR